MDDIETIRSILTQTKTIAVVGLSPRPDRPSFRVAQYLQAHGYRIIPVNPAVTEVLGEKCYGSLRDIPEAVDVVDCFRGSEQILPIAQDAIAIGAKCLWLQIGVINEDAAKLARDAGLYVVMNRCLKIEHAALLASQ